MRYLVYCVILLLVFPVVTLAKDLKLQEEVIKSAESYLYVREQTGNNDSPEIDAWLKYLGLPKGLSYCAAFGIYNHKVAAEKLGIKQPLPKSGRVSLLWKQAKKDKYRFDCFTAKKVFIGARKLQLADSVIWSHGRKGDIEDWLGHYGHNYLQTSNNSFDTIEGNTGSGNKGSQREGNGVWLRHRKLDIGSKFQVEGFIRVR